MMGNNAISHDCSTPGPLIDGDSTRSLGEDPTQKGWAVGISWENRSITPGPGEARGGG